MIKNNKWKLLVSSIVILLPIVAGLFLWNKLPEQIAVHWGVDGNPDRFAGRSFAVFAPSGFMLALHWVCVIVTALDHKNRDQNGKVIGLIFWLCPFISIFMGAVVYAAALGMEFSVISLVPAIVGILFVVIGNYMPKCKQNHTIGIRIKWTLESEANWAATHRLCGKAWVIGGILLMLCIFLPESVTAYSVIIILSLLAIIPIVYSYVYHRRQSK